MSAHATPLRVYTFTGTLPYQFDFTWAREQDRGALTGATPFRFASDAPATFRAMIRGDFRVDQRGNRVALYAASTTELAVRAAAPDAAGFDALLAALLGVHPVQWMRAALTGVGSPEWLWIRRTHGARRHELEALLEVWSALTTAEEAELWAAITSAEPEPYRGAGAAEEPGLDESALPDDGYAERIREQRRKKPWSWPLIHTKRALEAAMEIRKSEGIEVKWSREFGQAAPAVEPVPERVLKHPAYEMFLARYERSSERIEAMFGRNDPRERLFELLLHLSATALKALEPGLWTGLARRIAERRLGRLPDRATLFARLEPWKELRSSILASAGEALAQKLRRATLRLGEGEPLIEASFDGSDAGCEQRRRMLSGELSGVWAGQPGVAAHGNALRQALEGSASVAVRLPVLDHMACRRRGEALRDFRAVVAMAGEVAVRRPDGERGTDLPEAIFLAAAGLESREPEPVDETFSARIDYAFGEGIAREPWRAVLEHFGLGREALAWRGERASLEVRLDHEGIRAWERLARGCEPEAGARERLQRLLRALAPAAFFAARDRLNDGLAAASMLAFAATPPLSGTERVREALERASRRMGAVLGSMHEELRRDGHPAAEAFRSERAPRLLSKVAAYPRIYKQLLRLGAEIADDVLRMAESARDVRQRMKFDSASLLRRLQLEAPAFGVAMGARVRQMDDYAELHALSDLLLIEAVAALAGVRTQAVFTVGSGGFAATWASGEAPAGERGLRVAA